MLKWLATRQKSIAKAEHASQESTMTREMTVPADIATLAARVKPELLRVLDTLSLPRQVEVLDFARFLQQETTPPEPAQVLQHPGIELHIAPATTLLALTGLVTLGGDAVADTEAFYGDNGHH
jgi:hypothetical protein